MKTKQKRASQAEQLARARSLRVGQAVRVTMDNGNEVATTVSRPPWQLRHGDWVVGLEGVSGGYDVMRVVGV